MEFRIQRTSDPDGKRQPCSKAWQGSQPGWFVDVHSLDDLLALVAEVGQVVVRDGLPRGPWLEIYDEHY